MASNSTVKVIIRNFVSRCNECNFELEMQFYLNFM